MNEELDKVVKENNCVPGINYISDNLDKDTRIIYEIYFKNEKEYKVVGSWYTKDNKLDKYSQEIYDELMSQGLCESGCMFIALDVKNKEEYDKMMEYLISCRDNFLFISTGKKILPSLIYKEQKQTGTRSTSVGAFTTSSSLKFFYGL